MVTGNKDYQGPEGENQRWYLCLLLKCKEHHVKITIVYLAYISGSFTLSY